MNELLFLGNDTCPTFCKITSVRDGYVIKYTKDGKDCKMFFTVDQYRKLRQETIAKFLDSQFMEDVHKNVEYQKTLSAMNKIAEEHVHGIYDAGISPKAVEDIKNYIQVIEDSETFDLEKTSSNIIESIISFMSNLTPNDREKFYSDIRTKIDSEFYGKIVISKEEYEKFVKQENVIAKLKELI